MSMKFKNQNAVVQKKWRLDTHSSQQKMMISTQINFYKNANVPEAIQYQKRIQQGPSNAQVKALNPSQKADNKK